MHISSGKTVLDLPNTSIVHFFTELDRALQHTSQQQLLGQVLRCESRGVSNGVFSKVNTSGMLCKCRILGRHSVQSGCWERLQGAVTKLSRFWYAFANAGSSGGTACKAAAAGGVSSWGTHPTWPHPVPPAGGGLLQGGWRHRLQAHPHLRHYRHRPSFAHHALAVEPTLECVACLHLVCSKAQ